MTTLATQAKIMSLTSAFKRERPVVLHADDDMASLLMAEGALNDAGFDVFHAGNGAEACDLFEEIQPDLIIMDAIMPEMDGFEAISHIRQSAMGQFTPILMITGLDDLDSITRAYEGGATDFLTKPINYFVLPHRLQYMLRTKNTADALRVSQLKLDNAQRIARLGHWEWNSSDSELSWSRGFSRIFGLDLDVDRGSWDTIYNYLENLEKARLRSAIATCIAENSLLQIEVNVACTVSNMKRVVRFEAESIQDETDDSIQLLGTIQDVTERTNAQKQIHDLAYFDIVTGLPNRAQFNERLRNALLNSRNLDTNFAVLFLDLDRFKQVNDTLGHDAGDDLLKHVSERLLAVLRHNNPDQRSYVETPGESPLDIVARLGGDEFVVLLGRTCNYEDAANVAARIAEAVRAPYTIAGTEVSITTTIGISVYPTDGTDSETLMKHADIAMYHAKENGKDGYQFYSKSIHEKVLTRFALESDLKQALDQDQLTLVFQPKVSMITGEIVGVEALTRWNHPTRGEIHPSEFIPLAEETGLIVKLGSWVMKKACECMQCWVNEGVLVTPIAINCSPIQFDRGSITESIDTALKTSGLDPELLEVELTESLFLNDIEKGINVLNDIKSLGVQVSVDDFGTGFSSLSYLKRLPVDKLKIDHSFVKDLPDDSGDAAIVTAIITLAHNLNLSVVAEGVETEAQFTWLQEQGCDEFQGYLASPALTVEDFESWLADRQLPLKKASGL
ncbi:MAG: EAL domain-containing protein [Gammaproteobacteria bacterium]|nr:EAL domain-containing protein [Gammaproteobacteria bacterium]